VNILDTRITKAKIKDGQLEVALEGTEKDTARTTTLRSLDGYHPDLQAAFDACVPHVRDILGWPDHLYAGELTVTGVSWSHSENTGVDGAVMVCQAKLPEGTCNSPFCFNTPHLPFDQYAEDGEQPTMPGDAIEALNGLRKEVQAYLDGKRAQGDMFARTEEKYGIPAHVLEDEYARHEKAAAASKKRVKEFLGANA
jgi:hypothetical protein